MTASAPSTPISVRYPEPNDSGAIRHLTLCRIEADDGTVGWGEAVTSWPDACRATEAMIDGIAAELVVGRDPLENVDIWRSCRRRAWWYGNRGGISSFALSAIDIALWDLKGKLLGVTRHPAPRRRASRRAYRRSRAPIRGGEPRGGGRPARPLRPRARLPGLQARPREAGRGRARLRDRA